MAPRLALWEFYVPAKVPGNPFFGLFNLCVVWPHVLHHVIKLETTLSLVPPFSFFPLKTIMFIHFQIFTGKIFWINNLR